MASSYSPLKIQLMTTGENNTTWGNVTNINLGTAIEEMVAYSADVTFSSNNIVLTLADTNVSQTARNLRLNLIGTTGGSPRTLTVPAVKKPYIVNNTNGDAVTIKTPTGTGVSVPAGQTMWVYNDSVNVVDAVTYLSTLAVGGAASISGAASIGGAVSIGGALNVASTLNVTGNTALGGTLNVAGALTLSTALPITSGGTGATSASAALTALGAAASGANSDITSLSGLTTALSVPQGGTGATTLTGILKGSGTSAFSAATAGTDYVAPGTATAFTALQTFSGSSSVLAAKLVNAKETVTISTTAASGTINFDATTQSVLYYTTNASANWTVNLRASSGTTMNAVLSTGESITVAFLATQGSTAYYNNVVQVDGSTSGVTTVWLGGAPAAGNASGIDVYSYTVIKTGSATFTVLATLSQFK